MPNAKYCSILANWLYNISITSIITQLCDHCMTYTIVQESERVKVK